MEAIKIGPDAHWVKGSAPAALFHVEQAIFLTFKPYERLDFVENQLTVFTVELTAEVGVTFGVPWNTLRDFDDAKRHIERYEELYRQTVEKHLPHWHN